MVINRTSALRTWRLVAVLAGACALLGTPASGRADDLSQAARELRAKQAAELEALAAWCDQRGLTDQARTTRELLGKQDFYKLYVPVLPKTVGPAELPADPPPEVVEWHQRFARLRREQANALFDLARDAVRRRRASLAFDLVLAAVRTNPDHEAVRRLLGYQKYRGRWHTFYEVGKLRAGQVWHEKFGWLPQSRVRRYEQGQRFDGRRWITAEEDAKLHRDVHSGWLVDTEHYSIRTNHSLEAGVALGAKLERLFRLWRQLFIRYYLSEDQVVALFDGRARRAAQMPKFSVVFFRDREDYNRSLRAAMPNIGMSIGVYIEQTRRAYFFAGQGYEDRTLYHEATHQLFHQSRRVAPNVGRKANFWICEGIALYMETLRCDGDYYSLGGFDDQRMHAARYRLLQDGFYVPLEKLTTFNMEKLQTDERIATLYSQAAGLTNFLVHYDGGRYRDALVAYLSAVYNGRDTATTLTELTNASYSELDTQYRQFIRQSVLREAAGGAE